MLKPFWALEGQIDLIKRIECDSGVETVWEDENGDRSIIYTYKEAPK